MQVHSFLRIISSNSQLKKEEKKDFKIIISNSQLQNKRLIRSTIHKKAWLYAHLKQMNKPSKQNQNIFQNNLFSSIMNEHKQEWKLINRLIEMWV